MKVNRLLIMTMLLFVVYENVWAMEKDRLAEKEKLLASLRDEKKKYKIEKVENALWIAADGGDVAATQILIDSKEIRKLLTNPELGHANPKIGHALYLAARKGHSPVVEILIKAFHKPIHILCGTYYIGDAIATAASKGYLNVIKVLADSEELRELIQGNGDRASSFTDYFDQAFAVASTREIANYLVAHKLVGPLISSHCKNQSR